MALASLVYDVPARVILDSAQRAVTAWDLITSIIKAWVFGTIISVARRPPQLQGVPGTGVLAAHESSAGGGKFVRTAGSTARQSQGQPVWNAGHFVAETSTDACCR